MTNSKSLKELIAFNRQRAQVERQMGQNQLASGNDAGKFRIDRSTLHDETAEQLARLLDLED
jgi:3-hydroxyisobutyrate dehydrogenase-like beta-hydroxyacid dehydrogenase